MLNPKKRNCRLAYIRSPAVMYKMHMLQLRRWRWSFKIVIYSLGVSNCYTYTCVPFTRLARLYVYIILLYLYKVYCILYTDSAEKDPAYHGEGKKRVGESRPRARSQPSTTKQHKEFKGNILYTCK